MNTSSWADDASKWWEDAQAQVSSAFEPTVRLGVTGLSRAGKTVFIASLAANLLRRGRMLGLDAISQGRLDAAALTPQPDMDAPRFEYERAIEDLYAAAPVWPEGTRHVSQLRISLRRRSSGIWGGFKEQLAGVGTVHLDIVDYPGEWLLDLALIDKSYAQWSAEALALAQRRPQSAAFLGWLREADAAAPFDEPYAQSGAAAFAAYLRAAKVAGASNLAPGRFLLPGEMEGAPALTFTPLAKPETRPPRGALYTEMAQRYEAYKRVVVRPFFRDHFSRLDMQVVLVDALSAISKGPDATREMRETLSEILSCFRQGENGWMRALLGSAIAGRKIDRMLLAVTKADHVHSKYHPALQSLVLDLLEKTSNRAELSGARLEAMALAGVRATIEEETRQNGQTYPVVRGRLAQTGAPALLFAGEPPSSVAQMEADDAWAFEAPALAPPILERRDGEGPPHIRLDRALQFLIGDKLE